MNALTQRRYLTGDLPGIGGRLRERPEDFLVEELPLYAPTGSGQHMLFAIEKRGLGTLEAIRRLSRALNVPERLFGSAGLKDAQAITRQILSVEGASPEAVLQVQTPELRVLWAERHRNRLKIGHLAGNRFVLRIRGVPPEALVAARAILDILQRRGVPNGFGEQRFGGRGTTHLLGCALVRRDPGAFLHVFVGQPSDLDGEAQREARALFEAGTLEEAARIWRPQGSPEAACLRALAQGRGPAEAVSRIPKGLKRLYVSAYQAELFNRILAQRMENLDVLRDGDLALKHVNGAFFRVEDAAAEQPRADRLEISPTGPLFGPTMRWPEGEPGREERELLADEGLTPDDWRLEGGLHTPGDRRPLRVPLRDVTLTYDEGVVLGFSLPPGAYATNVAAEVIKADVNLAVE